MALAIYFEGLLASGEVTDMADLVRLDHVIRTRLIQIMNLHLLHPAIQETLLFLLRIDVPHDFVKYIDIRLLTFEADWITQQGALTEFQISAG